MQLKENILFDNRYQLVKLLSSGTCLSVGFPGNACHINL